MANREVIRVKSDPEGANSLRSTRANGAACQQGGFEGRERRIIISRLKISDVARSPNKRRLSIALQRPTRENRPPYFPSHVSATFLPPPPAPPRMSLRLSAVTALFSTRGKRVAADNPLLPCLILIAFTGSRLDQYTPPTFCHRSSPLPRSAPRI